MVAWYAHVDASVSFCCGHGEQSPSTLATTTWKLPSATFKHICNYLLPVGHWTGWDIQSYVPQTCNQTLVPFSEVAIWTEAWSQITEVLYTLWMWCEQSFIIVQGSKYLKSNGIVMHLLLKLTHWVLLCSIPCLQHVNQICTAPIQLWI